MLVAAFVHPLIGLYVSHSVDWLIVLNIKTASPNMDGSIVFVMWRQRTPPFNTCFLWSTRVHIPNSISIGLFTLLYLWYQSVGLGVQTSIKFTAEPPEGVKAGLKRTYSIITQDQLDVSNMPQWKPLLYDVAFLHTTVQVGQWTSTADIYR